MGLYERIEGVKKLFLRSVLAVKELDIVNQQQIERMVIFLEAVECLVLIGAHHIGHVLLGVNVAHVGRGVEFEQHVADRLDEMRLAETYAAIDEKRVVGHPRMLGNLQGRGTCELVRLARHERVKSKGRIEPRLFPYFWFGRWR